MWWQNFSKWYDIIAADKQKSRWLKNGHTLPLHTFHTNYFRLQDIALPYWLLKRRPPAVYDNDAKNLPDYQKSRWYKSRPTGPSRQIHNFRAPWYRPALPAFKQKTTSSLQQRCRQFFQIIKRRGDIKVVLLDHHDQIHNFRAPWYRPALMSFKEKTTSSLQQRCRQFSQIIKSRGDIKVVLLDHHDKFTISGLHDIALPYCRLKRRPPAVYDNYADNFAVNNQKSRWLKYSPTSQSRQNHDFSFSQPYWICSKVPNY